MYVFSISTVLLAPKCLTMQCTACTVVPQYKAVFEKEHRNNWYSVKAYFIAQTIADIPFQIVLPLIYGTIVYGMTGLRSGAEHVAQFLFICVLQTLVGQSLGECWSLLTVLLLLLLDSMTALLL